MDSEYLKNFPVYWEKDKIDRHIADIATDPKILWQQISGQNPCLWYDRKKYIADGVREGRKIRVILEPNGRGILTAYLLE